MDRSVLHNFIIRDFAFDTYRENILFIRADSHVRKSEGFTALTRVVVNRNGYKIVATLNLVHSDLLKRGEASLSQAAMTNLNAKDGDTIAITHLQQIESLGLVRGKLYGRELSEQAFQSIINDIVAGYYSSIEIAAFVSACTGNKLSVNEITSLTKAMISSGDKLHWSDKMILDKHCVGGLPGNRTTPIVVSIVAAAGLTIPKTSSRAITSPAGTADTMETMTPVNLTLEEIRKVVEKEGGCFTWGGSVNLSPADDLLITVEKSLDIDGDGQMVASVLSKKAAAGSTHVIIDIPVGPTAKVRSNEEALLLQYYFKAVSDAIGLHVEIIFTDGTQPIGRGIGPSLEAMDVLSVLRNNPAAPADLKERSILLAAALLRISGKYPANTETSLARTILENGQAYKKFRAICEAQGGFKEPVVAPYHHDIQSETKGTIQWVDNRKLARVAKLAGAPKSPSAGVLYNAPIGKHIEKGDLLFRIYAESQGELDYALEYFNCLDTLIKIEP